MPPNETVNKAENIKSEKTFSLAGRLMLKRVMGKASFGTIQDQSGKIQFYIFVLFVVLASYIYRVTNF